MSKSILLLRLSYWAAAITDFVVAILFLIPERMGETQITYPMLLASVIVFSWTVMLVVADRKPLERRWVIIPTVLVVALISIVRITFSLQGVVAFSWSLIILGSALIVLMTYSYFYAGRTEASS